MDEIVRVRDRARFVAPGASHQGVIRVRLNHHYAEATGRVVRVLAPGGYGKSAQVAQWVASDDRRVTWLDLERIDNDPYVLAAALSHALSGTGGLPADTRWMAPHGRRSFVTHVVPEFGALFGRSTVPFVLVLDDVHNVDADAPLALLDAVAANLPDASTLILSGRAQHGQRSIGRLRLRPGVIDVTTADLALDPAETGELLSSIGLDLEPDQLALLAAQFEGWPAGLRLAGLVLRSGGTTRPPASSEAGDASFVVEYLRAEWTAHVPPEHLQFLREAACLERFTGDMCDAVLGRSASATLLEHLHRDRQLLLPLDQRAEWYRMHTLLARWLSSDLKRADPLRWYTLHVEAATWWERNGDIDLAFDHALLADDLVMCEVLAARHGPSYLTRGMHTTVRRWFDVFSADHVRSSGPLCALGAVNALHDGDGLRAIQWTDMLERLVETRRDGELASDPPALWACALQATLRSEPATGLMPLAEHAAARLDGGPWHALAHFALGGLRFLTGDHRAAESFAAGAFEAELAAAPLLQANCIAAGAILTELDGDREQAADAGRRARAILVQHRAELGPTTALVDVMHALTEVRAGDHPAAQQALATARQKLGAYDRVSPWFNVLSRLPLLRVALLLDDRPAGRALLREIERHLATEPVDQGARGHLDELRTSVDAAGRLHGGPGSSLTSAELRVLDHLPTNLTIADIAARLYISRNTAKTHVAAIYRKLGTTSRRDTVRLARRAGLLDGPAAPDLG